MSDTADDGPAPSETTEVALVMIAKPACLNCAHLIPRYRHKRYSCYGDRNCPAVTVQIDRGVDQLRYSRRLADSMARNDTEAVAEVMQHLSGLHPAIRERVMNLAMSRMRRQTR